MLLLSAILWNAATLACMCHEVYQQLAVTFVVTSRICVTEYLSGYARPRLYALSSGLTRVSCYTIWVRDMLHADVISHICHKSEERCECLKESSKQQCEAFILPSGGFWLAEGILGPLSLLSLTEADNNFSILTQARPNVL